ncbi:MAG: recombinase family protein [Ruminococcus sp.]|nr:recombinase family protein [Ruminococcus sp.]
MKNKQPKKAALYCRLSVDDGRMGESVSIGSQKLLLEQYCKDHAIDNYEVYDDDGYSGTNFDRPAFQRMYEDIQNGLIDTVLVKDQSRFGRSYIEVGMYVEKFKELGVRFIAVSDNYDSMKNENDMMFPMRNVLNDYFAREASIKTKTAKKAKAKAGQYIGSKPPFGYKLDPNDRHHLVIDEPAAETVRRIFRMAAQGIGYNKTTKIFREEKVLTPIAYFNLHNPDYFKSDYWRKEFDWHVTSIRVILENEVYLGKLIYGKQRCKSMKSKEKVKVPREDWIIVENCHEPIITQELWDEAHRMMSTKRRPTQTGEVQMFAGLLYCADCGHALTYSQKKRKDGTYHGAYSCWMYKTHGKEYCASHYITYDVVYKLVLKDIRRVLKSYRNNKNAFRSFLDSKCSDSSAKKVIQLEHELEKAQGRVAEIDRLLNKLYEDNALGKISDDRYAQMTKTFEEEQAELKKSIPELTYEITTLKARSDAADKFTKVIDSYTDIKELNADILNELIDIIVVHHKEKLYGKTYQQVEIYYRFVGELKETVAKAA